MVQSSEEEDDEKEHEEEEAEGSDSSAESSEDFSLPVVTEPRRTGRVRRFSTAVHDLVVSERDDGSDGEGRQQQAAALIREDVGGPSQLTKAGRDSLGASGSKQRRSYKLVTGNPASGVQLLQLKAVDTAQQQGGEAAGSEDYVLCICDVCGGDGDAVDGSNAMLMCNGKGCRYDLQGWLIDFSK